MEDSLERSVVAFGNAGKQVSLVRQRQGSDGRIWDISVKHYARGCLYAHTKIISISALTKFICSTGSSVEVYTINNVCELGGDRRSWGRGINSERTKDSLSVTARLRPRRTVSKQVRRRPQTLALSGKRTKFPGRPVSGHFLQ